MGNPGGTYKATYRKKGLNPFKQKFGDKDTITKSVTLTKEQADMKDELAKDATPKGYEFIECELI